MNWIPLNKYFVTGHETDGLNRVIESGHLSGRGNASLLTEKLLSSIGYRNPRLTPSCTSALEALAIYLNIGPGDEVIIPAYTFVASATAFANRGAKIVYADSSVNHPNVDCSLLESLVTPKTKAILLVHYGGMSCDMATARKVCEKYDLTLIEDAAHAFFSRKNDGTLIGTEGDLACFSFHDTKNISCGEGGMIVRNTSGNAADWSVLLNKGTNREAFEAGAADHYEWTGNGGSFGISELQAAFLYYQVKDAEHITNLRRAAWNALYKNLEVLQQQGVAALPYSNSELHNAHIFYLELAESRVVDEFTAFMKSRSITCARHYFPLHLSRFGAQFAPKGEHLSNATRFGNTLVRIPVYSGLTEEELTRIVDGIRAYFKA